jgi:GNAT superfamily N-acetyltransferase
MNFEIFIANSDQEINGCFSAFKELRPQLLLEGFVPQVRRQQLQGYQILAFRHEGLIKSAAGFRISEFLAWGKILYIDDLTTLVSARSNGFADQLMDWLINHAREQQCKGLHLDTGYARHNAHRLYLRKKLLLTSHHMSLEF